ncbi:MAG: hypothetical protein XE10_2035 [Methanoculleus marisnigri]|uniref:Uncharacterized protein n=1 Tax=Methanoculleus marisnigri TaxID=2198 RepID=A0A101IP95_9EURY|nr:MAG: hypothetical protein XE10_2035 [Methanoculleus marisnigri]
MKGKTGMRALSVLLAVMLVSVNDYSNNPDFGNLDKNDENAQGFYYQLGGDSSWWGDFIYGNGQVLERHWKDPSKPGNGIDYIYTDDMHFAFFSGHGYNDGSGFAFGTSQDDFKLHYNDALWGNHRWTGLHSMPAEFCERIGIQTGTVHLTACTR